MSDIIWRRASDEPEHNQFCHIRGQSDFIRLSVCYKKDVTPHGWLDALATPGAGAFYTKEQGVVAWIPEEMIPEPPDEWFEEVQ